MATSFSSPDQITKEAAIPSSQDDPPKCLKLEELEEVFEVKRCQDWITENKYSR